MGPKQEKTHCAHALLQSQQENGSWLGDFTMRIPPPDDTDPDLNSSWSNVDGGGNSFINDKDGLFATAMTCYALDCFRQEMEKDELPKKERDNQNYRLNTNSN